MWLVYVDHTGGQHYQPWRDLVDVGTLIDPDTGDDMELIGWTDSIENAAGDGQAIAATAQFDSSGNFAGHRPRACGEHRTVGDHRAWCFNCAEWCYPDEGCIRCRHPHG